LVTDEVFPTFGEAVRAMMHKLRGEDSIYQFTSGVFGILLPRTTSTEARRVAVRVADGLTEAMGASRRYSFDIRITSFPEHAKTAKEMEALMSLPAASGIAAPRIVGAGTGRAPEPPPNT
jgi:GGDEF domain-containing protein